MVSCLLRGGPKDGRRFAVPLPLCLDSLAIEGDSWFRQEGGGAVSLVAGERPRRGAWINFSRHVYRKAAPVKNLYVAYVFDHTEDVRRCEAVAAKTGRRCLHEARLGSGLCQTHLRGARRVRAKEGNP